MRKTQTLEIDPKPSESRVSVNAPGECIVLPRRHLYHGDASSSFTTEQDMRRYGGYKKT